MAVLGGIGSAVGGLAGLLSGAPASNVPAPPSFNTPNLPGAAGGAYSGIQNLPGVSQANSLVPYATSSTNAAINNPYLPMASNLGINNAFNT